MVPEPKTPPLEPQAVETKDPGDQAILQAQTLVDESSQLPEVESALQQKADVPSGVDASVPQGTVTESTAAGSTAETSATCKPGKDDAKLDKAKPSNAGSEGDSALPAEVSQQSQPPVFSTPQGPPDRTLELAGLQALMAQQKQREIEQHLSQQPPAGVATLPQPVNENGEERVDWTTHKKEGMRLKRLMEENAQGASKFPHMAKMWSGSKEDSWWWVHFVMLSQQDLIIT